MKLEQIVTSRELSEKLAKYIKGESLFEYRKFFNGEDYYWSLPILVGTIPETLGGGTVGYGKIKCWTATELAELMKNVDYRKAHEYLWDIHDDDERTDLEYKLEGADPDKLGEIFLYLCENNLINLTA